MDYSFPNLDWIDNFYPKPIAKHMKSSIWDGCTLEKGPDKHFKQITHMDSPTDEMDDISQFFVSRLVQELTCQDCTTTCLCKFSRAVLEKKAEHSRLVQFTK